MTDDEIDNIDQSMCGERECHIPFARAIIAAHEAKLREGVEVPERFPAGYIAQSEYFVQYDEALRYGDARALAARDAVIEECAVECEGMYNYAGEEVAMCIRALKRGEA